MKLSVLRPRRDPAPPEPTTTTPEIRPPWWREWIPSGKTLREELRRNPGLKLISLLLAILLWGTINVTERDAERIVELPVSLRKLQQGLIVTNPPGKPVTITLRGPRTILDHVDEHTSRVSVDLSSIGPGDARIELNTDMVRPELPRRLKVLRMEPARVKLKIDRLVRRSLPVRADLAGTPALGFMVAESRVVPDQVEVSGPAAKVDELKEIPTEPIDLRGMKENGERSVLLGWVGDFIGFAPDRVTVSITFEQVMVSREFKRVPVRARRGDGVAVRLTPAFVDLTVRGPQVILHNLKLPDDAVWVDAAQLKAGTHRVSPRIDLPAGLEVVRWQPDALQAQVAEGGGR